jgi:pyruvate-formate lyase-activating enzyme
MTRKRKNIVWVASVVSIIGGCIFIFGVSAKCIDRHIEVCAVRAIDRDPRLAVIQKIKDDTEEIKMLIAIMNRDNPEYEKAVKALKARK